MTTVCAGDLLTLLATTRAANEGKRWRPANGKGSHPNIPSSSNGCFLWRKGKIIAKHRTKAKATEALLEMVKEKVGQEATRSHQLHQQPWGSRGTKEKAPLPV